MSSTVIFFYLIDLSSYELHNISIIALLIIILICGLIGFCLGEEFMEKVGEWLSRFV